MARRAGGIVNRVFGREVRSVAAALAWRDFSEGDWCGFAGAERFECGEEPRIAGIRVDGEDAVIIHDNLGLAVQFGESDHELHLRHGGRMVDALMVLTRETTTIELKALGFTVVHL